MFDDKLPSDAAGGQTGFALDQIMTAERRPPTGIASSKMEPSESNLISLNSPPWFLTKVEAASNRLGDAGLSAGAQAIGIGAADHAGLGAERERALHVLAKAEPRHPARALI